MYIFTLLVFILSKEGKHLVLPSLSHSLLSLSLSLSLPNQAFSWLSHPFEALGQRLKDTFLFNLSSLNFSQIKIMRFNTALENPLQRTIFAFLLRRLYMWRWKAGILLQKEYLCDLLQHFQGKIFILQKPSPTHQHHPLPPTNI